MALAALLLGPGGQPAVAATATEVGIDANSTGNSATFVGIVQPCRRVEQNQLFSVDIFIKGVAAGGISAFITTIFYNSGVLRIPSVGQGGVDTNVQMLLASTGGSSVIDQSDPESILDNDNLYTASAFDQTGNAESGNGVLARVTFKALGVGASSLSLRVPSISPVLTGDDANPIGPADSFGVFTGTVSGAQIFVGQDCPGSNSAPTADNKVIFGSEDTQSIVTLTASDPEGVCPLSFEITSAATDGTLGLLSTPTCSAGSGSAIVTFNPDENVCAPSQGSFQYAASDGIITSAAATVTVNITCVNDPPTSSGISASTPEETPVVIALSGQDMDNDCPLTFVKATNPIKGSLGNFTNIICTADTPVTGTSTTTADILYTPNPDAFGSDSYFFKVTDLTGEPSSLSNVSITINALDDPPVAEPDSDTTNWDTPIVFNLTATDADGDCPLTFSTVAPPSGGTLGSYFTSCTAGSASATVTYSPDVTFAGPDSFTYKVTDPSLADSNIAPVSITVNATDNDADGLLDHLETAAGCVPGASGDSDSDGLTDGQEVILLGTACTVADTDGDGYSDSFEMALTGTVTGANAITLVDADSSYPQPSASPTSTWTTNQWAGFFVTITGGTGSGQTRAVVSNTAATLNIDPATPWSPAPVAGSTYSIQKVGTDPFAGCAADTTRNNEPLDATPPDLNDDQSVNVSDVGVLSSAWRTDVGTPNYALRLDLNADGSITILDVGVMASVWRTSCVP